MMTITLAAKLYIIKKNNKNGWSESDYSSPAWQIRFCCHQALGIKWDLVFEENSIFKAHLVDYIKTAETIINRKINCGDKIGKKEQFLLSLSIPPSFPKKFYSLKEMQASDFYFK